MNEIEVSFVIPCLNESATLASCILRAQAFLTDAGIAGEVVVADNGSDDGSDVIARKNGARVVKVLNRGYGYALREGMRHAKGTYVVMGDADGSYDFGESGPILRELRTGADLVVGNRFEGGIRPGAMPFLNRYLGNPVLSGMARLFYTAKIGDYHCGLRGVRRDVAMELDFRSGGMEFATEMIAKAHIAGKRIEQVPVSLSRDERTGSPHLRPFRDGVRHLRFMAHSMPFRIVAFTCLTLLVALTYVWLQSETEGGVVVLGMAAACLQCMLAWALLRAVGCAVYRIPVPSGIRSIPGATSIPTLTFLIAVNTVLGGASFAWGMRALVERQSFAGSAPALLLCAASLLQVGIGLAGLLSVRSVSNTPTEVQLGEG